MTECIQELRAISTLSENPNNVRTHSKKQILGLAKSIRTCGFAVPIVADENGMILAGHARLAAAKYLDLKTAPVVVVRGLSEPLKRAFMLADNKIASKAGYDRPRLAKEIAELTPLLIEAGVDIGLTGFETPEIDELAIDHLNCERDPIDDVPTDFDSPVSRPGDLWELGRHRLLCGDSREASALQQLMNGTIAAMQFSDPPYNVSVRSIQGRGKIKHGEFMAASGEMSDEKYVEYLTATLGLAEQHLAPGAISYVCMDWRHIVQLHAAGDEVYSELKNIVVWNKTNAGQGSFYRSQYELIFVYKVGEAPHQNNFELGQHGRHRSNVWTYPGVNSFRKGRMDDLAMHPTVKPVALVTDAMRDCSRRGDIVLDPFMGSGTTIMAAEKVGRRGFGLEIDPRYVDTAIRRWQAYTKKDATLSGTGEKFDDLVSPRRAVGGAKQ